jgi:hypothetical protein
MRIFTFYTESLTHCVSAEGCKSLIRDVVRNAHTKRTLFDSAAHPWHEKDIEYRLSQAVLAREIA